MSNEPWLRTSQSLVEISRTEANGETVIEYRCGKLMVTGTFRRPSDQALAAARKVLSDFVYSQGRTDQAGA